MVITVIWVRDNEDLGLHTGSEDGGGRVRSKGVSMTEYTGFGVTLHKRNRDSKKWTVMFQS